MASLPNLLIIGASARAAAFSAIRAGLRPVAIDLFNDTDLCAVCPTIPAVDYPHGVVDAARQAPPGPWLYTGGLENRPEIVARISRNRRLWGNGAAVLRRVRSPAVLARVIGGPAVRFRAAQLSPNRRWLIKPWAGTGGTGVRFWDGDPLPQRRSYFQEYIDGEPCAAIFVGSAGQARLLGITHMLVGTAWLHAAPFHYCGSIGPLLLPRSIKGRFARLGKTLVAELGLRGLFGVDCILRDGVPVPVEVNPRYTASVEVLEYATGIAALGLHRQAFERAAGTSSACLDGGLVGKGVYFAPRPLTVPTSGPWAGPVSPLQLPAFADIPPAGQLIDAGRPILTFFARGATATECLEKLRKTAADLDRRLFGR